MSLTTSEVINPNELKISDLPIDKQEVIRELNKLTMLTFAWSCSIEGKTCIPLLQEITGLSYNRIKTGNLDQLKPNKTRRVIAHSAAYMKQKLLKVGYTQSEVDEIKKSLDNLQDHYKTGWSSIICFFDCISCIPLPQTKALAFAIDDLFHLIHHATIHDDIAAAVAAFRSFFQYTLQDSYEQQLEAERLCAETNTWISIHVFLLKIVDDLLIELLAAWDAEWGAQFMQKFEPRPIFLWLAPRANPSLNVGEKTQRNAFYFPIRRLLELSYLLSKFIYTDSWPKKLPGRKDLAESTGYDETTIGNWFDRTKHFTIHDYEAVWRGLCQSNPTSKNNGEIALGPIELVVVAALFDVALLNKKDTPLSVTILDEDDYTKTWERYRKRLATQHIPDQIAWPDILTEQSLLPKYLQRD